MPPVVIGAAIVGAGVVAGSAIASQGANKAAETQAEAQRAQVAAQQKAASDAQAERTRAVEKKEAAIANIKFPTFFETPEAQELRGTLRERIAGRGLVSPVSPLDIDKQTAPFAAQRRAGLKEQTIPAITSAASARGLGRSTIPVGQIGQASQAAERDINQRVADLQIQNKKIEESNVERERVQVQNSLTQFERLVGREATSKERKAIFDRGAEFSVANTIAGDAEAFKEDQFAIANSIADVGVIEAANELKQAEIWASAVQGLTQSAASTTKKIIDALDEEKADRQQRELEAQVNIGL